MALGGWFKVTVESTEFGVAAERTTMSDVRESGPVSPVAGHEPETVPGADVAVSGYAANTAYLFLEKGGKLVLTLLVSVVLARHLGGHDFGVLNYAISYAALFGGLASLGLDFLVVRDLVNDDDDTDALMGTTFWIRLAAGSVIYAALVVSTFCTGETAESRTLIWIVGTATWLQAFRVIELFFQARVVMKYSVVVQLGAFGVYAMLSMGLTRTGAGLSYYTLPHLVASVCIASGLMAVYLRRGHSPRHWRFHRSLARRLLNDCWPMFLSSMMIPVITNMDRVMIQYFLGSEMVGNYSVAVTLSSIWNTIPIAICTSLLPAIVAARNTDPERYQAVVQKLHHLMLWVSVLIAVLASLMAKPIVALLYGGTRYPFAAAALSIHVWSIVPMSVGVLSSYWLVVEGLQRLYPVRTLATAVVVVALNAVWIPRLGINGAAIATICAQLVSVHLIYLADKRTRRIARMQIESVVLPIRWIGARIQTRRGSRT